MLCATAQVKEGALYFQLLITIDRFFNYITGMKMLKFTRSSE